MSLRSIIKGWVGEAKGTLAKKLFLNSDDYVDVNNVTIPGSNRTTQIDHVIVSRYGVFVVETKNKDGWIFGNEKSATWTQCLFGKKYKFQNPLFQNYHHTKTLSEFLDIDHNKFISIIMFWGGCKFKTDMPHNVLNRGYVRYIKSFKTVVFSVQEVQEIVSALRTGMLPKSWGTHQRHVAALKKRFSSTTLHPKLGDRLR